MERSKFRLERLVNFDNAKDTYFAPDSPIYFSLRSKLKLERLLIIDIKSIIYPNATFSFVETILK